uniref:Col_cuticle_N domain-containing protein n=1 Tax=Globodera pallida TaxID=36090 RepID=A0A183CHF3_GLOPA
MTNPTQISPKEWNALIESLGQMSPNENPQHPESHIAEENRPPAPGSVQKHLNFVRPKLMRNSIMPTLAIPKMPWPPTLVVSSMPSPNTVAAFPIARKRPAPGLPPLQLPDQSMQLNFKMNKAQAASKKKQQKLTAAATAAAEPSNKIGGEGQKQIIAATQHQRTAGSAFLAMSPTSQTRYIVEKCLLSLNIRHLSIIIIEPIARIQRGEPVVESLTNAKLALARELRQMVPFEVAERLKQSVVDNVHIKSSNIFVQIIEEIKTNSIAIFGQTLLTRDEVVVNQQNGKAPEIEKNIGCANVLFFLSRLFRKLAGLLSAPYDERIEFSIDLRGTRRVALALWLSGMREQFVLEFERFTTFLAFEHRDKSRSEGQSGTPGRDGVPGLPAEQGASGEEGRVGAPGANGPKGNDAEKPIGRKGPRGPPGEIGNEGTLGAPGNPGGPGKEGAAGPPGAAGFPGAPGNEGEEGGLGTLGKQGQDAAYCPCPNRGAGGAGGGGSRSGRSSGTSDGTRKSQQNSNMLHRRI